MQPGGVSQELLGVDAVREFNVLRDSYGAEYGKRPGAQVMIVTQSGTNEWHGSLYEFLRNNAFDARNFFDGSSVSGLSAQPVWRLAGRADPEGQDILLRQLRGLPAASASNRRGSGARQQRAQRLSALQAGQPRAESLPVVRLAFVGVSPLINAWPAPAPGAPDFGGIAEAFNNPLQTIRDDFGTVRLDHIFSAQGFPERRSTPSTTAPTSRPPAPTLQHRRREPARAGGQRAGDARLFAHLAEHFRVGIFARRIFLHRRAHARNSRRRVCPDFWSGVRWARVGGGRQRGFESDRRS